MTIVSLTAPLARDRGGSCCGPLQPAGGVDGGGEKGSREHQRIADLEEQLDDARDEIHRLQRLLDPQEQRTDMNLFTAAFEDLQEVQRQVGLGPCRDPAAHTRGSRGAATV